MPALLPLSRGNLTAVMDLLWLKPISNRNRRLCYLTIVREMSLARTHLVGNSSNCLASRKPT